MIYNEQARVLLALDGLRYAYEYDIGKGPRKGYRIKCQLEGPNQGKHKGPLLVMLYPHGLHAPIKHRWYAVVCQGHQGYYLRAGWTEYEG